ncbi:hypothetical protein EYF80_012322 [Liparis tanakae]|uniref:Uncharacterized protein n=1 Tax=Liparis tanakae TaxID=230148 RepID=A0A4Z2II29_9TELE|nr:hypothetical protein EYF80_012322 [Liparis tanakae]
MSASRPDVTGFREPASTGRGHASPVLSTSSHGRRLHPSRGEKTDAAGRTWLAEPQTTPAAIGAPGGSVASIFRFEEQVSCIPAKRPRFRPTGATASPPSRAQPPLRRSFHLDTYPKEGGGRNSHNPTDRPADPKTTPEYIDVGFFS